MTKKMFFEEGCKKTDGCRGNFEQINCQQYFKFLISPVKCIVVVRHILIRKFVYYKKIGNILAMAKDLLKT